MRYVTSLAAALMFATPAAAQTVDAAGVEQLSSDLKRYLSEAAFTKGIVSVSLDGDAYRIALDYKPLAALLPKEVAAKIELEPYSLRVKPRGDGTWDVSGIMFPNGSVEVATPMGPYRTEFKVADSNFEGVYDPAIAAFTAATGSNGLLTTKTVDSTQNTEVRIESGKLTYSGVRAAGTSVDFTMTQEQLGLFESIEFDDKNSGMNFPLTVRSPAITANASGKAVQSRAMLDLLVFWVANADEAKIKANQGELKTRLLAALPLWNRLDGAYVLKDLAVESPVGNFSATSADLQFGMDGVSQSGTISYGIKLAGLKVPTELLPPWSARIVPTDFDLNLGGADLDTDTFVRRVIDALDLTKNPPIADEVGAEMAAAFLAKNPKLVIGKSLVRNADTQVAFSGDVVMQGDKPDMNLTIDATGYDKMVDVIKEAASSDPQAQQAFPALLAAKGFAKAMPDGSLQWVVNVKPDGSIFINGGMVKGADPIPSPAPLPDPNAPTQQ